MHVALYRGETDVLDAEELAVYLDEVGFRTEVMPTIMRKLSPEEIAGCKVRHPFSKWSDFEPLPGEVRYEERMRESPEKRGGILYDADRLAARMRPFVACGPGRLNVALTDRLVGTFGGDRYHARTVYAASPSIVSSAGLVEGPARPREFYERRATPFGESVPSEIATEGIESDFLEHGDPRLTEVARGMVLQAAFYRATGDAFCDDPDCMLFNAHTQGELLTAQLDGELCGRHGEALPRVVETGKG
ncbi:MAG: hypothetical protein MAG715_00328 [Methanonatronarchaeales archaeon]|nr:hypothetical protein [Methanonatronarchaeales archaeon]